MSARLWHALRSALAALATSAVIVGSEVPRAWAGAFAPCYDPIIFSGSDVNLILVPYALNSPDLRLRQDSIALWQSQGARALALLIQFDTLYSLRYPAGIAVVQLFADGGGDCAVEEVKRDVEALLAPGKGAVFLWGGLVEHDGEIFIQSYVEFFRKQRADQVAFDMPSPLGRTRYLGTVPQSGIGLPPHILTQANMASLHDAAASVRRLSSRPGGPAEISLPEGPEDMFAFIVTDIDESGWLKIRGATSDRDLIDPRSGGFEGWLPAKADTSIRSLLPELDFVDGAIGHVVAQIIEEERQPEHWAGDWVSRYYSARARASAALNRFIRNTAPDGESSDIDAATSVALASAMQAAMALKGPPLEPVESVMPEAPSADRLLDAALVDLDRATTLIPYHPETRNLLAIALSARAVRAGDDAEAGRAAAEWQGALSLAPGDTALLANLAAYYQAMRETGQEALLGLSATQVDERLKMLKPPSSP